MPLPIFLYPTVQLEPIFHTGPGCLAVQCAENPATSVCRQSRKSTQPWCGDWTASNQEFFSKLTKSCLKVATLLLNSFLGLRFLFWTPSFFWGSEIGSLQPRLVDIYHYTVVPLVTTWDLPFGRRQRKGPIYLNDNLASGNIFANNCIFFVSSSSTDPQDSFGDFQILCLVGCGGSGGPRALAAFWWNGGLPPWTGGLSRGPGQLRPCIPATPLLPLGRRGCHTRGMAAFLSFVSSVSFTTCTPHSVGGTGYSVQVEMPYL